MGAKKRGPCNAEKGEAIFKRVSEVGFRKLPYVPWKKGQRGTGQFRLLKDKL